MEAFFSGMAKTHAPEDHRVPGKQPDHANAWVDEKDHIDTAPQTPEQKIKAAHAIAEAAVLHVSMDKTDDRDGRFNVINTIERVDDPETRHLMMAQYKTMSGGKSLETSLSTAKWHSERDKEQALDLISTKRDQAHATLVSLPPDKRKKVEDAAEKDAAKILAVTRGGHADDDEVAQDIFRVLGPKEPHEIEAIRAAVRANTQGRTIYQELDLSMSGGNEDEALAGLKGDPVHSAAMGLINADGDADRTKEILRGLDPEQVATLKNRNPFLGPQLVDALPANHQAEVTALLGRTSTKGAISATTAAADGAQIAELFTDATHGVSTTTMLDTQKMKDLQTHTGSNLIDELRSKTPEQIASARESWEATHPGQSWDKLVEQRFGGGDANTYLRVKALANGDVAGERAYALRQAMRDHDQDAIEAALSDPNVESADPMKKALAHAQRLAVMGRVRQLDEQDLRTTALATGQDPTKVVGRTLDQQLTASYADYGDSTPEVDGAGSALEAMLNPADKRRAKAKDDHVAARDLIDDGQLSISTKVRKAKNAGDAKGEAQLLDGLSSKEDLDALKGTYQENYGDALLEGPDKSKFSLMAKMVASDDEAADQLSQQLAYDTQTVAQRRVSHVMTDGVRAERTPERQLALQKELNALGESSSLDDSDLVRASMGKNLGSGALVRTQEARLEHETASSGNAQSDAFRRADGSMTSAQDVQTVARLEHAEQLGNAFMTMAKLAAMFSGNPLLYAALDAGATVGGMAIKSSIAGSDYKETNDIVGGVVGLGTNLGGVALEKTVGALLKAGGNINRLKAVQTLGNLAIQTTGTVAGGLATGQSSEEIVAGSARGIGASFLPALLGSGTSGLIKGSSRLAKSARTATDFVTRGATNYALNGGGGADGMFDIVANTAGDTAQAHNHGAAHDDAHVRAHGHYAEDVPSTRHEPVHERVTQPMQAVNEPAHARVTQPMQAVALPVHERTTQPMHAVDVPSSERVTQPMQAVDQPVHKRVTQRMQAVDAPASDRVTERMQAVEAPTHDATAHRAAVEPARKPTSLSEQIDQTTGVDKGAEYDQFRRDMAEMYANQEVEAQNVTHVRGQTVEAKKDGYNYVGNTAYDVRRFAYDNATLTSVTLDAHLRQGAGVTSDDMAAVKGSAYQGVDQIMNSNGDGKRHTLPDGSKLQVEPTFHENADAADHVADVVLPSLDERGMRIGSNQGRWVLPDVLNPVGAAHELVGHGLGFPDTYFDPNTWFRDDPNSPHVTHDGSFMETVAPGANLKQRHIDQLGRDISAREQANGSARPTTTPNKNLPTHVEPAAMPPTTDAKAPVEVAVGDPKHIDTAQSSSVIPATAAPRSEGSLGEKRLRETVVNELALATPAGSKAIDQNTVRVPAGDRHVNVVLEVGNVDGGQSAIHQREDGSYRLVISDQVADVDATRAIAHGTVAVQRHAEPESSGGAKRPPADVEGRAAELRVVLSQVDQRGVRHDERSKTSRADDVSSLLGSLGVDSSPEGRARLREALAFDPALLRRTELHLDGYEPRHDLDAHSDLGAFGEQRRDRLAHLEQHIHGPHSDALRQVEDLSLGAQLRLEEGHRIFDGANVKVSDPVAKAQLMERRQAMVDTMNDPRLSPEDRRTRLAAQIDALGADPALQVIRDKLDLEAMHKGAAAYENTGNDHGAMALDLSTGLLRMPGAEPNAPPTTIRDVMRNVDAANQAAAENGLGVNYVVVVHQPSKDAAGSELSHVEIIGRKQPRTRHLAADAPKVPGNAGHGDLVVDHGVGRGGFAVESATVPEGGMIVQSDHISKAHAGQMSRENAGITDAGPLTAPGAVMMFADLLMHPGILKGAAHEPNAGIRQSFVNNVSAKYEPDDYTRFADQLAEHMPEGSTVEVQWTMAPEKPVDQGGYAGDRGHIQGDKVAAALEATGRSFHEESPSPIPGDYTIDAATRASADPDAVGKFTPPTPEKRRVITFGGSDSQIERDQERTTVDDE